MFTMPYALHIALPSWRCEAILLCNFQTSSELTDSGYRAVDEDLGKFGLHGHMTLEISTTSNPGDLISTSCGNDLCYSEVRTFWQHCDIACDPPP